MSINLPVVDTQPYPTKNPWYDLSSYLAGGLSAYAPGSVIGCPDGNLVHYSFHVLIDRNFQDPDYVYLFRSMHPSFRVTANTKTTAWFSSPTGADEPHGVEISQWGSLALPIWRRLGISMADYSMGFLNVTASRRKP